MSDTRQGLWDIFTDAVQTFDRKNEDYGDAWRRNGWRGNLSRVFEKADRVRNLAWRPDPRVPAVGDEQVVDTLKDMLNTIAFAIMNLEEEVEYGHETPRSQRVKMLEQQYQGGEARDFFQQVSEQLPHRPEPDVQVLVHGHDEVVRTEVIATEDLRAALTTGPDEMRPVEQQNSGHVTRKNGPRRAVADKPQA